jgi:restriction endonuclease Mrr
VFRARSSFCWEAEGHADRIESTMVFIDDPMLAVLTADHGVGVSA